MIDCNVIKCKYCNTKEYKCKLNCIKISNGISSNTICTNFKQNKK